MKTTNEFNLAVLGWVFADREGLLRRIEAARPLAESRDPTQRTHNFRKLDRMYARLEELSRGD